MRIGLLIPNLHGGGAEFVTRRWIEELHSRGHEVTVYVYDRRQPPVDLPSDVLVHAFAPRWRAMRHAHLPLWLHRQVARDRPEVLLSMMTYSNVIALLTWAAFRTQRVALVVSERNIPSLEYSESRGRDQVTVWLAKRLYRHAAGVIAISHPVGGDLVSAFNVAADRLYVVPNPVIAAPNPTDTPLAVEHIRSLHIAFVGRLVEQKRPGLFLEVLAAIGKCGVNVRGTVIGDGPLREQSEREAAQLGVAVSFIGWHEPWWAAADVDCVLLTARFEGLANVLVEAAAVKIPSVACSRALGVADAIVPGLTGEFAMTDSPDDYAEAVLRACSNTAPTDNAIPVWLRRFSVAHSTESLLMALGGASSRPD